MKTFSILTIIGLSLFFSEKTANAIDHVPYYVLVQGEEWKEEQVWARTLDGGWAKKDGEYYTVPKWTLVHPRRAYVVKAPRLFWMQARITNTVYEVPEACVSLWDNKLSGNKVVLPTGFEGWKKLGGGEMGRIRDEAKSKGRYFASPHALPTVIIKYEK